MAITKKSSSSIDRLVKEIDKINNPTFNKEEDKRFWKLTTDKAGNGMAIIRFLPPPVVDGEDSLPWVRIWDHGFKGPTGKWYIEKSLTTLNQKDPLGEYNSKLWNASNDDNSPERKQARDQKRRLSFYSNILVVSDPKNPDNNGKVFLFKYGKKIFTKISEALNPPYDEAGRTPDDPDYDPTNAFNPFDMKEGANFVLKSKKVAGYPNYDSSIFEAVKPISKDEKYLEEIYNQSYSLKELIDPKHFKTYGELKSRLEAALGKSVPSSVSYDDEKDKDDELPEAEKEFQSSDDDDDDEDLKAFKSLAG